MLKPDLPRANQSNEAALAQGPHPPSSPGTACSRGLPLLHSPPSGAAQCCPALDALWTHPEPPRRCDLGQGTSFPTPLCLPELILAAGVCVCGGGARSCITSLEVTWAAKGTSSSALLAWPPMALFQSGKAENSGYRECVSSESGFRLPVVATGSSGLSLWFGREPEPAEPGKGGDQANLDGASAFFLPLLTTPSSPKRLVQCVTPGPECPVCFMWPLSSPTLGRFIFILPSRAGAAGCQSPVFHSFPLPSAEPPGLSWGAGVVQRKSPQEKSGIQWAVKFQSPLSCYPSLKLFPRLGTHPAGSEVSLGFVIMDMTDKLKKKKKKQKNSGERPRPLWWEWCVCAVKKIGKAREIAWR